MHIAIFPSAQEEWLIQVDMKPEKSPLQWVADSLQELQSIGLKRVLSQRESPHVGGKVQIDGTALVDFGSNDYLGLAADPRLIEAVRRTVLQVGWGAGASPLVGGRGVLHAKLEREIAEWEGVQRALLFPTGFAANVGTVVSLVGRHDAVFSDQLNHASLIDGCKLSGAKVSVYRHVDMEHLEWLLQNHGHSRRRLIVTDALFSMDGDFAPLMELVRLAKTHDCMLLVDEAHATGVWGTSGKGVCEMMDVAQQVHVKVGTLSKALGSLGGFVLSDEKTIEWIANKARTFMFSTAQPEAISAASLAALEIVRSEPQRRQDLCAKADRMRRELSERGLDIGASTSQIIPIVVGEPDRAVRASERLRQQGFYVPAIRPPAVSEGRSLLRLSLTYSHTDEQLSQLAQELGERIQESGA